jgi:hypothetical protein
MIDYCAIRSISLFIYVVSKQTSLDRNVSHMIVQPHVVMLYSLRLGLLQLYFDLNQLKPRWK